MPSLMPAAATLDEPRSSCSQALLQRALSCSVSEPLARRRAARPARLPTARRARTAPRRTGTAARASSADRRSARLSRTRCVMACCLASRSRPASRASAAGSSHETSTSPLSSSRSISKTIEPLPGERGLAAEPLHVLRHELGARAAARRDSIAPLPPLIANSVSQSSGVRWRPSAARYAEKPSVLPSGCSRSTSMSRCWSSSVAFKRRELRLDLRAPIRAQRGIDARELRRQRLLAAFELHDLGLRAALPARRP